MRRPGKTIDAAMFTTPVSVHGPIERDIGRLIEAEDRPGTFFGHLSAQLDRRAVQRFHMIAPVAIHLARGEAEACRHIGALCAASGNRWFETTFHEAEHTANKKAFPVCFRKPWQLSPRICPRRSEG